MLPNQEQLKYICEILSQSFGIAAFIIDENGSVTFEASTNFLKNPMYNSVNELLTQLLDLNDSEEFPVIKQTDYLENFISVKLAAHNQNHGAVLIGPVIDSQLTDELIKNLLSDLEISSDKKEEVFAYYKELVSMSKMKITYLSLHLYFMIYQKQLDPAVVIEKNRELHSDLIQIEDSNYSVSKRRQEVRLHHDLLYEEKVLQCIVEGNKEEVIRHWRSQGTSGELGLLSKKSHLRHIKNIGISVITLATRAAMKGGVNHEIAYTLSDLYIQNLEDLKTSRDVDQFIEFVLGDFADRTKKNKQLHYSRPVNHCLTYIFNHLYEDITLNMLADISGVHPNYLSSIFSKEVGTPIRSYILNAKIEEAKTLIQFTDYSLLEISTLLNFYDQSYFTKIFKKFTGVTPNQYKDNLR